MVNFFNNRAIVGLLLLIIVSISFFFKIDLFFFSILTFFVFFEIYKNKFLNKFFLIIFVLIYLMLNFTIVKFNDLSLLIILFSILCILASLFLKNFVNFFFSFFIIFFLCLFSLLLTDNRDIFYLIIYISFLNDTSAYIFGKFFKGPKISKKISPNKTWSGTICSIILSSLFLLFLNFSFINSIVISILFFYGDLYFSYIKRYFSIKDFSSILSSHGGVLDRLDSITFSSMYIFFISSYYV